jgi:threonyl-tRNA synthetase
VSAASGEIEILLPDGSRRPVPAGTSAGAVLQAWRPKEFRDYLAARFGDASVDLSQPLVRSGALRPLTFQDPEGRDILQHSSAHVVAKAVTEVVPGALPTAGPPTEEGFYYDFDVRPLTPEDQAKIEAAIAATIKAGEKFERQEVSREEANRLCAGNPYKLGYIREIPEGETVSFYRTGPFLDLCRGPHVPDTHWLRGLHLLGISAVSADGTATGPSRQRVRGVGFPNREELDRYLTLRKEAEARDHRIVGPRMELFMFTEDAPGFPFWLPKGMIIVRELERFVTEHLAEAGYAEIRSPLMFTQSLFETSGHWTHYRENMFLTVAEERTFAWKPMNCPGSMLIFRSRPRSYRELPLRLAEFAPLHRFEASGTLHGMTRVREFVQDDAHLFVTEEQVEHEIEVLLKWIDRAFTTFHLEWSYELSTRPTSFLGDPSAWDRAEATLEKALKASGVQYKVSPGEGAFYGPKIDIHIRDSLGRRWQTGTIQLDYQLPLRFGLEYQGADGALHTPVVIHRTILGSWERFFGVLLEHCAGRLPPWLCPVQVRVLPVTERHQAAADALVEELRRAGLRSESSGSQETLSKRVREAEIERIPYVLVVGDTEVAGGTVALRTRGAKGQRVLPRNGFLAETLEKVRTRAYDA